LHSENFHQTMFAFNQGGWDEDTAEMINLCKILFGIPQEARKLGRRNRRFNDNIKPDLGETGCEGVDGTESV
jgi:hypothetical protein